MTVTPSCDNERAGHRVNGPGSGHHLQGGSDVPKGRPGSHLPCSISGCDQQAIARGWCAKHYARWRNYGHPTEPTPREALAAEVAARTERFWAKVEIPTDPLRCWVWTAAATKGYGKFRWVGDRLVTAHRLAYELTLGPIPPGLDIDHICRNRSCVNPLHLDPVTNAENTRRGAASNHTHCGNGHRYPAVVKVNPRGHKRCPECERENGRIARERRRNKRLATRRSA